LKTSWTRSRKEIKGDPVAACTGHMSYIMTIFLVKKKEEKGKIGGRGYKNIALFKGKRKERVTAIGKNLGGNFKRGSYVIQK